MKLLWFLLGLAAGLAILGCYRTRLNSKLKLLLQDLPVDSLKSSPSVSRLATVIHQQRQLSQHLEQELAAHEQILQTAPIGYLQVDDENQLCWSNLQARQLLGIEKLKGQTNRRLLLELVRSYELDCLIEEARITQLPCQTEWMLHPSVTDPAQLSRSHPLRGHAFPLSNGYVGVFLADRQEAVTLTQERDRWASDVAHELKTPLTSIRLVAETLQSRLNPPLRTWVDRLLNETTRLSTLVQDLLELSRLTLKLPKELTLKTVDLPRLVHSTWLNLEPLTTKKQLWLDYVGLDCLLIQADEPRLYRVLLNLLDNSIKYSPAHQAIKVRVSVVTGQYLDEQNINIPGIQAEHADAGAAHIEVIDAGPGFPDHALPYVFERFYRVDPARSRNRADDASVEAHRQQSPLTKEYRRVRNAETRGFRDTETRGNEDTGVKEDTQGHRDTGKQDSSPLPLSPSPQPGQSPSPPLCMSPHSGQSSIPPSGEAPSSSHSWNPLRIPTDMSQTTQTGSSSGLGLAIVQQIIEAHGGFVRASNHPETGGAWLQIFLPFNS